MRRCGAVSWYKSTNTDAIVGSKVQLLTQNVDMDVHGSEEIEEMLAGT